jgi:hypothetical protein
MRYALIALGALVAATSANIAPSEAAQRAWCQRGGATDSNALECLYSTFRQCYETAFGNNGSCVRNPFVHERDYREGRDARAQQRNSNWNWN